MSRQYKFRGKPTKTMLDLAEEGSDDQTVVAFAKELKMAGYDGDFVYGQLVFDEDQSYIVGKLRELNDEYGILEFWIPVIPETVGQYTGLTDKNGKEIYEGDIVSFDGNMTADDTLGFEPNGYIYDEKSIHSVVWGDEYACWEVNFVKDEHWKYKRDTRFLLISKSCVVIGNIHDNPELLK